MHICRIHKYRVTLLFWLSLLSGVRYFFIITPLNNNQMLWAPWLLLSVNITKEMNKNIESQKKLYRHKRHLLCIHQLLKILWELSKTIRKILSSIRANLEKDSIQLNEVLISQRQNEISCYYISTFKGKGSRYFSTVKIPKADSPRRSKIRRVATGPKFRGLLPLQHCWSYPQPPSNCFAPEN